MYFRQKPSELRERRERWCDYATFDTVARCTVLSTRTFTATPAAPPFGRSKSRFETCTVTDTLNQLECL
jgi:hypothetical protein